MCKKRCFTALFMLILASFAIPSLQRARVLANGVPIQIALAYLPDISNWGPEDAAGEAVVSVGEGWVTVRVQGLPKLQEQVYVAWIVPKTGAAFPIGKFNTDDAGRGSFELRGLSLPREPYRLFLITVEPDTAQYPAPGAVRSIAGRFPDPELLRPATPAPPTATPAVPEIGGGGNGGEGESQGEPGDGTLGAEVEAALAQPVSTPVPAPVMLPVTGGVIEEDERGAQMGIAALVLGGLLLLGLFRFAVTRFGGGP